MSRRTVSSARSIEWAFLFLVFAVGIALANLVGFHVGIVESLPGILILVAHGAGVLLGSFNAHRINAPLLKAIVATGSVAVALLKLLQTVL